MGQYNKAIITTAGENMIARAVAGEIQLNITKAKTSDHKYPGGTDYKAMTDMQGIKQVMTSPETKILCGDMIQTRTLFSNEEIQATYYIQNIGLYAMDGTNEILFCIVTAATPDEMPKYNDVASTSYIYNIQNTVHDAAELNIIVSPSGIATLQDVLERVDATGGNISETVIETLEPIDTKYPVPSVGESTKVFMGKVKKYIEDTKPLDADMFVYVATTGSDTTGTGESTAPYKTITYALSKIPKMLNGFTAAITVSGGAYNETVQIEGVIGKLEILLAGDVVVNGFNVIRSTVTCRSSNTTAQLLSVIYINVDSGRLDSFSNININTTGFLADAPYASRNSSIFVSRGELYLSGVVNLLGNTDIGVAVATVSDAFIGTLIGTGLTMGKYIATGSQLLCAKTIISASQADWVYTGVRVGPYGAMIGTLPEDTTLYVSTTGSNTGGDGTSAKPFKTIQYAINRLPKDLAAHTALILISDGNYEEYVSVSGFYNGYVVIKRNVADVDQVINNLCNIRGIHITYCTAYVDVHGINITANNVDGAVVDKCPNVTTFFRCQSVVDDGSINSYAFKFEYCNRGRVIQCHTQNKRSAILARHTQVVSDTWNNSSSTKGVALVTAEAGSITTTGIQPSSPGENTVQLTGGSFIKDNGTQISGIISAGLSCTWGTIESGYVRHGNLNGVAMVTICTRVAITSTMSAGNQYVIKGYPKPSINCCVTTNVPSTTSGCFIEAGSGSLYIVTTQPRNAGGVFEFNCTYLTYS